MLVRNASPVPFPTSTGQVIVSGATGTIDPDNVLDADGLERGVLLDASKEDTSPDPGGSGDDTTGGESGTDGATPDDTSGSTPSGEPPAPVAKPARGGKTQAASTTARTSPATTTDEEGAST